MYAVCMNELPLHFDGDVIKKPHAGEYTFPALGGVLGIIIRPFSKGNIEHLTTQYARLEFAQLVIGSP